MTEDTKQHIRDQARLRILKAREDVELSKRHLAEMATILEEIARMLRTVPSQFTELLSASRDHVASTKAIMAEAALDHQVVAAAVADHESAMRELTHALQDAATIGVVV